MSAMHPVVDWLLDDRLGAVVEAQPEDHPLTRVDRDNSLVYDGSEAVNMDEPMHKRTKDFERANFVGVRFVSQDTDPVGTEYDHRLDTVASVRIEGMRYGQKYGHIDPTGEDGVPFKNGADGLVDQIRDAILAAREYPDAGPEGVTFTDLQTGNEDNQAASWSDFYRYEFDVVFRGFEEL